MPVAPKSTKPKVDEEPKISKELANKHRQRLTFLKNGKEFFKKEDFVNATKCYNTYLSIIAEYKKVPEKKLSPKNFDEEKDLAEMLLISHTYWDLARIYDRTPSLRTDFERVLNQFVEFTKGYKYEFPNAGMLKRFIKRKKLVNKDSFNQAAIRLNIDQKKCYIATMLYGENHLYTQQLKLFRDHSLMLSNPGRIFIKIYYLFSPFLVLFNFHFPIIGKIINTLLLNPLVKIVLLLTRKRFGNF
jgi:hypothetical protein